LTRKEASYRCSSCGTLHLSWQGQCRHCGRWNTIEKDTEGGQRGVNPFGVDMHALAKKAKTSASDVLSVLDGGSNVKSASVASPVDGRRVFRYETLIKEFDRVCGGGLVVGSALLLGGAPGIGKSTLMLQLAYALSQQEHHVAYISGEETEEQVAQRARRMGLTPSEHVRFAYHHEVEDIVQSLYAYEGVRVVIIDSIQAVAVGALESVAGSVAQIRASTATLIEFARRTNIILLLVGHITKEGTLAGPKLLEHMVDTVLYFEHDMGERLRLLRAIKNRYGATNEVGLFEMDEKGLQELPNPSSFFLSDHREAHSGSAVFATQEGRRCFLLEMQALVSKTSFGLPRRSALGYDSARLSMVLAVLEARCGVSFASYDVYVNVVGGMKVRDAGADLAVAVSLFSALMDDVLPVHAVFCGEIGLSGEIRFVPHLDSCVKEAQHLGFREVYTAQSPHRESRQERESVTGQSLTIYSLSHVRNVLESLCVFWGTDYLATQGGADKRERGCQGEQHP